MLGLIIKIIVVPIGILVSNYLFGLDYSTSQAIIVSFVLIAVGQIMELFLLREGTLWISTIIDTITVFAIIYLSQLFLPNVTITVWAALGTALLVALIEYVQHAYLLRRGRTRKAEEKSKII